MHVGHNGIFMEHIGYEISGVKMMMLRGGNKVVQWKFIGSVGHEIKVRKWW